jgi:thiaminase
VNTIAEYIKNSTNKEDQKAYKEWINLVGGEKNVFLRDFLKNFRLA